MLTASEPSFIPAVSGSDPPVAVGPGMYTLGFDEGQLDAPNAYEVMSLSTALTRVYPTEACMVLYVVPATTRQRRINKPGLPLWTGAMPFAHSIGCDIDDMPNHAPWTDDAYARAREQDRTWPIFATTGVYYTPAGRRVIQPLARPMPVTEVEPYIRAWIAELRALGLAADDKCAEWNRHFRLPHITRPSPGGFRRRVRSPCIDLARMRAIEPALPAAEFLTAVPSAQTTRARFDRPLALAPAERAPLDGAWQRPVQRIARAVAEVNTPWHSLFLALAGALLRKGVPTTQVPAIARAIAAATHSDTRIDDRERSARTTIERAARGLPFSGFGSLRAQWPGVADAFDEAFLLGLPGSRAPETEPTPSPARAPPAPDSAPPTTAAITRVARPPTIEEAIEHAPPGVTLIKAECGAGKSVAAMRVMARLAATPYASDNAQGVRAPLGSKSAMAVDKHSLAIQCVADLTAAGTAPKRLFGPLSLREDDGTPTCRYHAVAEPLVAGGQALHWEFCKRRGDVDPCPQHDTCRARDGVEGPHEARIAVGPHALVANLEGHAGASGLLVLDEPPDYLETTTLTIDALDLAIEEAARMFDGRYVGAVKPLLYAARAFLEHAPLGQAVDAVAALRAHADRVPPEILAQGARSASVDGDLIDCAIAAPFPEGCKGEAPPLLRHVVDAMLLVPGRSRRVGRVSNVLRRLRHAVASELPVMLRVEEADTRRVLLVTAPRDALARALRRDGRVVVLDANVDLHAPIIARIIGYPPPMHTFTVTDGAPIARTLIRDPHANRKSWFRARKLAVTPALVRSLTTMLSWLRASADTRTVGIITYRALEVALTFCTGVDVANARAAWVELQQDAAVLDELDGAIGAALRESGCTFLFGHYGATRGLNTMASADAVVTLGDPWRNLGEAEHEAVFLGLGDWRGRYEAWCRAELEQAHGRLRTVHRTRSGRALHVGSVMPGGSRWTMDAVDVRTNEGGRPKQLGAMHVDELEDALARAGGVTALAQIIGCDTRTIRTYRVGKRAIPAGVADALTAWRARRVADGSGDAANTTG